MTAPRVSDPANQSQHTDNNQSIGEILSEVVSDVTRLFRQEVELAKAELRQEAGKAGRAGGMLAAAGVAGLLTAVMVSLALAALLAEAMHPAWAALIIGVLWALAGAGLYRSGIARMRTVSPIPHQTVESVKEDAEWLRNRK
jgi:uncharacterized membrane protein YqjE